jgi:hypothetical protein
MSISRDTFDPTRNYKRVRFHQDRDLLDSELNELQDIQDLQRRQISDMLFKEGAIVDGLGVTVADNILTIESGHIYIDGRIESASATALTYDSTKSSGADYVYAELIKYNYGYTLDAGLINPATGEPTAEREKWVVQLRATDTTNQTLPINATERKVVPIYKFDRETGAVTPTVQEKSNLRLQDMVGTLPGSRITVASITEDQLSFAAAEGLNSLLQNMAERTYDQAGSYLVKGFDSFVGTVNESAVEVITNAGRAYIQGFRLQRDLPLSTLVPKSVATKSVRGEQKTFSSAIRLYPVNNTPLKQSTQVEAIVEITANVTRGSVGSGEDLLEPNPVVRILEVSQGATIFRESIDWQQLGNYIDWLGSGSEPAIGTTYAVRWTYTKQLVKEVDYVDGGWFGVQSHPVTGEYFYFVTAVNAAGETAFIPSQVVSRVTGLHQINKLSWLPVVGATGYRVYRATQNTQRTDFSRLVNLGAEAISYVDDGVDEQMGFNPPPSSSTTLIMSSVSIDLGNLSVINFGRSSVGDQPVAGSNCSVDYDYYLGRKDVLYATAREIKRLEGAAADFAKLPIVPEGTLALSSIDCPPNSTSLTIENFGLTRITMDQIHRILQDIEDLKYNDAQYQMHNDLQNRDSQSKKGIYSDDFSSDGQSDLYHAEWDARINAVKKFAAPARIVQSKVLEIDRPNSTATFSASLALLPSTEKILIAQDDYSEERSINPYAVYTKPPAIVQLTPNIGRRGQTGIAVEGQNFLPNKSNITVRCDGKLVVSNAVSDEVGRVSTSFVIPDSVRNGDRIVEINDGTYTAQAKLGINDPLVLTRIERITVTQIIRVPVVQIVWGMQTTSVLQDPLAQTFSFTSNRIVSAVGLYFTRRDTRTPLTVQIRGVTTGLPNNVVYAEKVVAPKEINLIGETKVIFANPFHAEANTSYAVVLLTNSSNYLVRTATLGRMGRQGIITRQAYDTGVLLESSNAETWTPLNGSDLALRIYGYTFQSQGLVRFKPITGVQFSDLNLDEYSAIPEGTSLIWEYSLDGGLTWDAIVPAEEERLPNIAAQVMLRVRLSTTGSVDSPALNFHDVNLLGYLNKTAGVYLTRENELSQSVSSTKVYAQMNIPSGTTVQWFATNSGGSSWEPLSIVSTRQISQEWTEYTLSRTFTDPSGRRVRYKAAMTGTPLVFPRIHSLGATLS